MKFSRNPIGLNLTAAFLAVMALAFLATAASAQNVSAKIIIMEGDVTVKVDDKSDWTKASLNQELKEGAYVMTAFESMCELEFMDRSKMKVKELSKIQINKFSTEAKKVDTQVTLYNGTVRAAVHKEVDKNTQFQVKTPVSTISVRGTEKEITAQPGFGTTVNTISGVVQVTNNVGQSVEVKKDESTVVKTETAKPVTVTEVIRSEAVADVRNESLTQQETVAQVEQTQPKIEVVEQVQETIIKEVIQKQAEPGTLVIRWK